jgi:uracil-DNA glycosylase
MKKSNSESDSAATLIPSRASLTKLREIAADCRACPLWKRGTQTVFGEGPRSAGLMLIGEQPGNEEDLQGRPFVGPAGKLLDHALQEAGIDRKQVYVTNVT